MKRVRTYARAEVTCARCSETTTKEERYIKRRQKLGKDIYCSRACADARHSEFISGENNPNFNGTGYGTSSLLALSSEERSRNTKRYIAELKKDKPRYEAKMQKLHDGHKAFFATEEGKELRVRNGVKTVMVMRDRTRRTGIEVAMADELTSRGIEFEEQVNVGNKFVLDFYLPEYKLAIECDGDYWHTRPGAPEKDARKNQHLTDIGVRFHRFWGSEINEGVESCVDIVLATINEIEAVS